MALQEDSKVKKRWILIPLTAGLLALMVAGGAILAQGNGHSPSVGYPNDLASRVAEILNLDEATVQRAFSQAHRERQNQRLQALLERMLAGGRLTQEEADEMMNWFEKRPDTAVRLSGAVFFGGELMQRRLEHLLRAGALTEAEAEEVRAWLEQRPDVLTAIGHGPRDKRSGFHQGPLRWGKDSGDARSFFQGRMQRNQDGDGAGSFFRGPLQRGQDGGDAGSYRWAPRGFAPSTTTPGVFY
jgi:uncharacterized protein YggL (DUF469 family)